MELNFLLHSTIFWNFPFILIGDFQSDSVNYANIFGEHCRCTRIFHMCCCRRHPTRHAIRTQAHARFCFWNVGAEFHYLFLIIVCWHLNKKTYLFEIIFKHFTAECFKGHHVMKWFTLFKFRSLCLFVYLINYHYLCFFSVCRSNLFLYNKCLNFKYCLIANSESSQNRLQPAVAKMKQPDQN